MRYWELEGVTHLNKPFTRRTFCGFRLDTPGGRTVELRRTSGDAICEYCVTKRQMEMQYQKSATIR